MFLLDACDRVAGMAQDGGGAVRFEAVTTGPELWAPERLAPARVHEAEGPGRRLFALLQMARLPGQLVWVLPVHVPELPMLWGLPRGVAERLHVVRARGEVDLLWSVEEALRCRAVAAVVAEPDKELGLTTGRRLQLAAEAGRSLGLLLIRQGMGSNATETRWHCAPLPSPHTAVPPGMGTDSTRHHWRLSKNKRGTLGDWVLDWDGTTASFHMVSAVGERPRVTPPPL